MLNEQTNQKKPEINLPTAHQLLEAGVHFGHKTSKWNPKMKPYIFNIRGGIYIIDLEKSLAKLKEAVDFVVEVVQRGGEIIFVGTKPTAKNIVKEAAQEVGMPYVCERWLGGTLTNFKTISKRLEYYRELSRKIEEGELQHYTKKEQLRFKKELEDLKKKVEGIKNLTKLPEAVFVIDPERDKIAIREAKRIGLKTIAICDVNADPTSVSLPIPGNDDAAPAIKIIVDTIVEAIKKAKS